ncbi:MAG: hypothetical protein HY843_01920 [Bdellovibrio sp.]|nr:hypothetical protein [Bdellovibrio sp.]
MELKDFNMKLIRRFLIILTILCIGVVLNNCGKSDPPPAQPQPVAQPVPPPAPTNPCGAGSFKILGQCRTAPNYETACAQTAGVIINSGGATVCLWDLFPNSYFNYSNLYTNYNNNIHQTGLPVQPKDRIYFSFLGYNNTSYYSQRPNYCSYSYDFISGANYSSDNTYYWNQNSNFSFYFNFYFYTSYDDYSRAFSAPITSYQAQGYLEILIITPTGQIYSQGGGPVYTNTQGTQLITQPGTLAFSRSSFYNDLYYGLYLLLEHCENILGDTVECPLRP